MASDLRGIEHMDMSPYRDAIRPLPRKPLPAGAPPLYETEWGRELQDHEARKRRLSGESS